MLIDADDNYIYLVNYGLKIFDYSLNQISSTQDSGTVVAGFKDEDLLYFVEYMQSPPYSEYQYFFIYNVSNPSNPTVQFSVNNHANVTDMKKSENHLFWTSKIRWGFDPIWKTIYPGLTVWDLSTDTSPQCVDFYQTDHDCLDLSIYGRHAFISMGDYGLGLADIGKYTGYSADSITFQYLTLPRNYTFYDTEIRGNYLYAACGSWGLRIFDISDVNNIIEVGHCNERNFSSILIDGDIAYTKDGEVFLDIHDVHNPTLIATYFDTETGNYYNTGGILHNNHLVTVGFYFPMNNDYSTEYYCYPLNSYDCFHPLKNIPVVLTGDTTLGTFTDDSGYYSFTLPSLSKVTVIPQGSYSTYNPNYRYYPTLPANTTYASFMCKYISQCTATFSFGTTLDDLESKWGIETKGNPDYSVDSATGTLRIQFSSATSEFKMTCKERFDAVDSPNRNKLEFQYCTESGGSALMIEPVLLSYDNLFTNDIKEIAAMARFPGMAEDGKNLNASVSGHFRNKSLFAQLVIQNNGKPGIVQISSGSLSIDSISIDSSATNLFPTAGQFNQASDANRFGYGLPAEEDINNWPAMAWVQSTDSTAGGCMAFGFAKSNLGVKMTSKDTFSLNSSQRYLLTFKVYCNNSQATSLHCMGFQYSSRNENQNIWDIAGYASLGSLKTGEWNTVEVPLQGLGDLGRLQWVFKNNEQYPMTVYFDDIRLYPLEEDTSLE
jgi:hypothetical protein